MNDKILLPKEKAAIKRLRGALNSLPGKLYLAYRDGTMVIHKDNVSRQEFEETLGKMWETEES